MVDFGVREVQLGNIKHLGACAKKESMLKWERLLVGWGLGWALAKPGNFSVLTIVFRKGSGYEERKTQLAHQTGSEPP